MANVNVGTTATQLNDGTAAAIVVRNTGSKDVVISPGGYTITPGSQQRIVTLGAAVTAKAPRPGAQATVDVVIETPSVPAGKRLNKVALLALPVGSTDHTVTFASAMPSTSYNVTVSLEGGAAATAGCTAHPKTGTFTTAGCTITVVNQSGGAVVAAAGFLHVTAESLPT